MNGAAQKRMRQSQPSPVASMTGRKRAITAHSEGSSRRMRRPIAETPNLSTEAAMSEPASANITDIAGKKRMVSAAKPVT